MVHYLRIGGIKMNVDKDVIVIGAGTSGMMAAISAATHGASVMLVEKNKRLGKKLLLTGGGRCNVTNNRPSDDVIQHIPGNGRFLYSAFSQFDNHDIIRFFEDKGVKLKEEDHGRMFPVTNRSKTIVEALTSELNKQKVQIELDAEVEKLLKEDNRIIGIRLKDGREFTAHCVIIATGGKTYPYTGSTGIGYRLAKKAGHTVTPLFATESPIKLADTFVQKKVLQGLSLQDVTLSVLNEKGKIRVSHTMDMLFTHFGVSGPAALRCSMFVNQALEKHNNATLSLDALPNKSFKQLVHELTTVKEQQRDKAIKNALKGLLPERYLEFLLEKAQIDGARPFRQVEASELERFAELIKDFRMSAIGTYPIEKSFVTGGGVNLKEIDPKTLESKLVEGLFFVGELLDINGYTGGYNITAAFVTGYVAGKNSAQIASYFHY
ncbi:NAD(P)/FAD-dependent oxidoreductase [Vagococcus zengguangii]|uniref:NAD(P)/FAD-dependent oxidoreductase n=1 Tax=Vagococcus zengguangii TaxID=2571750 RepID=A0A4D7CSB4_9ENTE|nr:NAD(P)/FAD-dependent oxidoreductase [Vagococcus zengguangii]QCI85774.1 NAD(P)/FAD-dependent oxidoreductase [Vagococcus zengguangii]TLG81715.1 NAD(P)/FAD-dependent oxidoreductase [Vagococcus zengguangii]